VTRKGERGGIERHPGTLILRPGTQSALSQNFGMYCVKPTLSLPGASCKAPHLPKGDFDRAWTAKMLAKEKPLARKITPVHVRLSLCYLCEGPDLTRTRCKRSTNNRGAGFSRRKHVVEKTVQKIFLLVLLVACDLFPWPLVISRDRAPENRKDTKPCQHRCSQEAQFSGPVHNTIGPMVHGSKALPIAPIGPSLSLI